MSLEHSESWLECYDVESWGELDIDHVLYWQHSTIKPCRILGSTDAYSLDSEAVLETTGYYDAIDAVGLCKWLTVRKFAQWGVTSDEHEVCYCGGGCYCVGGGERGAEYYRWEKNISIQFQSYYFRYRDRVRPC